MKFINMAINISDVFMDSPVKIDISNTFDHQVAGHTGEGDSNIFLRCISIPCSD